MRARESLKTHAKGMKMKSAALEAHMEVLEKLQGPEDFFKFLQSTGLSHDEIQRSMSDPGQAEKLLERSISQRLQLSKHNDPELDETLKKINRLHDVVVKNKPLSKSEKDELEAKKKKKDEKILMAKKQPEMKQPTYRLKIGTERLLMMVQCDLPKGLKGVDLDLSEDNLILAMPGHLNLNVDLPKPVDPERAQAKFSKKSKELRISMPLVLEDEK
mmetsp:Transcript_10040/g.16164  ORF Transcript_10040/g.16164 Transcript_10040/m.16164 type:complete len:216 (-) Transcript_10040:88-735(-)